jgi:Tfp pilus assembly protein PilE
MNQAPQYPQQMTAPKKSSMPVWIIVIIVVVVSLVVIMGILGVLAIYGTRKYISAAKQVEARSSLSQIGSLATVAYARDGKVCPSASSKIPAAVPSATKYQSNASEWEVDQAANAGFACLGFSMSMPQYYQYEYKATATGFVATARGDLDGDGVLSELSLEGQVQNGALVVAPTLKEVNVGE